MNQIEVDAVEKCIELLKAGGTVEECNKLSAGFTAEMREMLATASMLMSLGDNQVSNEQMKRSLSSMLSKAASMNTRVSQRNQQPGSISLGTKIRDLLRGGSSLRPVISRMALVFGLTALLILLSGGLVITSAKSLPGDSLYPVKLAVEDITVYFVPSKEIRQEYEENYSQQRVDEVHRLIALSRIRKISFEGVLEEKNVTSWIVSGIPVTIAADATFVGGLNGTDPYVTGSIVEVEGTTNSEGGVTANEIHLRQYQFTGTVENIDKNSWQISGIKLSVTSRTQIEDGIKLGDQVSVLIRSDDNGLYAISILGIQVPLTMPNLEPTRHSNPTVLDDGIDHSVIENHQSVDPTHMESTQDNHDSGHDEIQATPVAPADGEHEHSSTVEPTDSHESDDHEHDGAGTPEQHGTPEPEKTQEGNP